MFSSMKETLCAFGVNSDKIFGFLLMTFYYNFYSHVNTLMQIESFFIFSLQNFSRQQVFIPIYTSGYWVFAEIYAIIAMFYAAQSH